MTKLRRRTIPLRHPAEACPVSIVSDASIATRGVADGRLIPLLILDTSDRPDIESMVQAHESFDSGDVVSTWGLRSRFDTGHIRLTLTTSQPSSCTLIIDLSTATHAAIIDHIIQAQGVYIQPGRPGDRLKSDLQRPRILVEIPSRHFRPVWEGIMHRNLVKSFRRQGLSRGDAKQATMRFLAEWRSLTSTRMPSEFDV